MYSLCAVTYNVTSCRLLTCGVPAPGLGVTTTLNPLSNELLAALPEEEYERLLPLLEPIDMALGEVLYESGKRQAYVYFPTDSIVSLVYVMENGSSAEVAIAGREGLVGVSLFMGGDTTPSRALVQSAGSAFRIHGSLLRKAFNSGEALRQLLLRYTQALLTQMSQTAVCNRHHTVDQQLCRWLLMSIDRLPSNKLVMTQELIANMLGVRREGVTEAAGKLQKAGVILYQRGRIEVIDRLKLERMVCECYEVVRKEYARLLPWTTTAHKAPAAAAIHASAGGGAVPSRNTRPESVFHSFVSDIGMPTHLLVPAVVPTTPPGVFRCHGPYAQRPQAAQPLINRPATACSPHCRRPTVRVCSLPASQLNSCLPRHCTRPARASAMCIFRSMASYRISPRSTGTPRWKSD